jgi:hypothetical protein
MKKFGWLAACVLGLGTAVRLFAVEGEGDKPKGPGGPGHDPAARFAAMDTDGNGSISLAEFKVAHEKRMAAMKERMGDKAPPAPKKTAEEIFAALDTNKDNALSKEEIKAGHPPRGPGGPGGGHGKAGGGDKGGEK